MPGHTAPIVEQFWTMIDKQDWEAASDLFAADAVQEWPQSGERIRGRDNIIEINKNYPGLPKMTPRRTLASGDIVVSETVLDYGGQVYNGVSIFEFKDDKIVKETDYFAAPFEAPRWRAQWVEKM
jgi:ketosteroid isomerase-like protein